MKAIWLKRKTSYTEKITAMPDKIIQDLTELPKALETL
jgi:FMN phosphatase YigB (HAD superfamily)